MAISLRRNIVWLENTGGGNVTPSWGATPTNSGNLLVAAVMGLKAGGVVNFSAPSGWVFIARVNNTVDQGCELWYYPNCPASLADPAFTSTNTSCAAALAEFIGADTGSPFDTSGTVDGTGLTKSVSASSVTTGDTELGFVVADNDDALNGPNGQTAGSGWTKQDEDSGFPAGSGTVTLAWHYRTDIAVSTTATETISQAGTPAVGTRWAVIIATFKVSSAVPGVVATVNFAYGPN